MVMVVFAPQAAAFDGWTEAIATSRHIKQVLAKAVKRITNLRLSQIFQWWRDQAAAQQHAQAQAAHIMARMQNQCLAAAFDSWVDAVAEGRAAAAHREQAASDAVTKSNALLLGQIFEVSCLACDKVLVPCHNNTASAS